MAQTSPQKILGETGLVRLWTIITAKLTAKQDRLATTTCALTTGMTITGTTVSVTGVTATNTVFVSPASGSFEVVSKAGIYCSAQGAGTLTFKAKRAPTENVTINVVIAD